MTFDPSRGAPLRSATCPHQPCSPRAVISTCCGWRLPRVTAVAVVDAFALSLSLWLSLSLRMPLPWFRALLRAFPFRVSRCFAVGDRLAVAVRGHFEAFCLSFRLGGT